jgi:8-oxo-dGTP pyrophosphatase MutT (NUDIX family)
MDTTWDGLPVARDWPRGASVVVRRPDGEVLLLHRAHEGPGYDGPWAWTTPAGSRQPGEAILPAARRELAEEAGIAGVDPQPVDLTGHWALFTAEVAADTRVALHDREHDRYEWVSPATAGDRVRPGIVAGGIRRALAVPLNPIAFAPLRHADLPRVVAWQNAPHACRWWTDPVVDVAAARRRYGPRIDGTAPTRADVIRFGDRPVGFIQCTPLAADPGYFEIARWATDGGAQTIAIDYVIGEAALVGRGIGTRVIWCYIRDVLLTRFPGTRFVVADPDAANTGSIRACEKAGFRRVFDFESRAGGPRQALCAFDRARVLGGDARGG